MKVGRNVQLTTAVPVSARTKASVLSRATRLLNRHRHCFGTSLLHIYVKNANARIGVSVNLFTDDGRYHSYVEDWDIHKCIDESMNSLHLQIVKHFEKKAGTVREIVHA